MIPREEVEVFRQLIENALKEADPECKVILACELRSEADQK